MSALLRAHRASGAACALAAAAALATCSGAPAWHPAAAPLMTRWASQVSPTNARPEYPRPEMRRSAWLGLNGLWEYALTPRGQRPQSYTGRILVPFAIESALSGVRDTVGAERSLWYRRTFIVPGGWAGQVVLLHFEAVDWETHVWVNGRHVGEHRGGYDPFTLDITPALKAGGEQELVVAVWDPTDGGPQPRGKQVRKPGGIFYTSVTGIWQTVWLEPVPLVSIRDYLALPDIDAGRVTIAAAVEGVQPGDSVVAIVRPAAEDEAGARASSADSVVAQGAAVPGQSVTLRVARARLWSPDDPYLYRTEVRVVRGGVVLDRVTGAFGMRKISVGRDARGVTRLLLNNRFVFEMGPLDQGYWPDGLYTAPTEGAMVSDLRVLKAMGFNMLRKHVKVEPRSFYSWCDRLGLLVWQDMPSASIPLVSDTADRATDTSATRQFEAELGRMIRTHWNHPSIVMWVPFNEGWGQYDTPRIARLVKDTDPTRLVDAASGWHERHAGDVVDRHNYPPPIPPRPEPARAAVQGEYGGLGLVMKGHTWKEGGWGYDLFGSPEVLAERFEDFVRILQRAERDGGLSAAVYTQTSDVETENNGLMTYDRAEAKIAPLTVRLALRGAFPPQLDRVAPIFVDSVRVAFAPAAPGAEVRYTTDGTFPRRTSPRYDRPFLLDHTAAVRARAWYPDGSSSRVSSHGFAQVEPRAATAVDTASAGLLADFVPQDGSWKRLPPFDSLRPTRTTVVTRIGLEPAEGRRENFGIRFRGYLGVPLTGVYTFHLRSDDGSRLRIDGQTIIEHDGIHGMGERTGWVALQAGMHPVDLAYFQGCCGIGLTLGVEAPSRPREGPVPAWWLFHEGPARRRGAAPAPSPAARPSLLNRTASAARLIPMNSLKIVGLDQPRQGGRYDERMVAPMRAELTRLGFAEARTPEALDAQVKDAPGTALVVVNSICGCAAGRARPGVTLALQRTGARPDRLVTVFAGNDVEATARAREYFTGYPPSSPQMGLMKDGKLVFMLERRDIEGRDAPEIAADLISAFEEHCAGG